MAKISFKLVPPEFELQYRKALNPSDRFTISSVRRTRSFTSKARIKGITQRSVLPAAGEAWGALTTAEQEQWELAGDNSNLTGWRLFVKDFAWCKKLELGAPATPDLNYQVEVGRLSISSPASAIKIAQLHPYTYFVLRKVRGTKSQFEPRLVTEAFGLPLELSISFRTNLVAAGADPLARAYIEIYSNYQGRDIVTELAVPFTLQASWQRATATATKVLGVVKGYTAFIECKDVTGVLDFDNVTIEHSGQNWARDPFCYNIRSSYTKSFFQIPRHWVTINVPEGAFFDSFYYNQEIL